AGGEGGGMVAADVAALRLRVHVLGIGGMAHDPEAVAAIQILPTLVADAPRVRGVAHPGAVVLQPAVDLIRILAIDADVVELRDRQGGAFPPPIAAVPGQPQAAIVAAHDMLGIARLDPDVVPVAMGAAAGL